MNIETFCDKFGANSRSINDIMRQWQIEELDGLLKTLAAQHDQIIGSAVVVGDALYGGTLLDQIPPEVQKAFANLMHEKANSYWEMRHILLEHCRASDGGFLSFNDNHILGFISKLKGQIGENLFQQHIGHAAMLAESGSQEAWDIAVKQSDGLHHYVQVKLYSNPHNVIRHMLKVHERVLQGDLAGVNHETVHHVYFAVPEGIKAEVHRLAATHEGLSEMLYDKTIPISADHAGRLVAEGMSNVGPDELSHFFHELLGGAIVAGTLHSVVNGFLWYKGSKEFSAAFASATASTAISTSGIGLALIAETLCHTVMVSGRGWNRKPTLSRVHGQITLGLC